MIGRTTDDTGAVVPNTTVTLRNEDARVAQAAVTNSAGIYTFQNLNPGSYTLQVKRAGFKNVEHTHMVVDVNQVNKQDVSLDVGTTSETVEVTIGVQQLQTPLLQWVWWWSSARFRNCGLCTATRLRWRLWRRACWSPA